MARVRAQVAEALHETHDRLHSRLPRLVLLRRAGLFDIDFARLLDAFKFAIRDAIPKVAYSTFLDTYMFRCEFYFFFAATACAVDFFVRQSFIIACCCALTLVVSLGSWVIAVKRALRHQQLDDVDDLQASPHPVDDDGTRPHHHQPPHLLHPETRIPWYCFRFEFPWFLPPPKGRTAITGADGARAVCSPPIVPVPTKGDIVTIDAAIKKPQSLRD